MYAVALETHWIGPLPPGSVVGVVTWSTLEGRPVAEGNGDSPSAQTGLDVSPLWSCRHEPSGEREGGRVWLTWWRDNYHNIRVDTELSIADSLGGGIRHVLVLWYYQVLRYYSVCILSRAGGINLRGGKSLCPPPPISTF